MSVLHLSYISSVKRKNSNPVSIYFGEGSPYDVSRGQVLRPFFILSPIRNGSSRSSMHHESRCFAVCVWNWTHMEGFSLVSLSSVFLTSSWNQPCVRPCLWNSKRETSFSTYLYFLIHIHVCHFSGNTLHSPTVPFETSTNVFVGLFKPTLLIFCFPLEALSMTYAL